MYPRGRQQYYFYKLLPPVNIKIIDKMSFIKRLLEKWSCSHSWKLELERYVNSDYGGKYTSYTYICEKCGKFKRWRSS
jgi:hypothetical protein